MKSVPAPRDLVTILYRPRDTMRRVLEAPARWWWQIAVATSIAASIGDADFKKLRTSVPWLSMKFVLPLAIGALIVMAAARVVIVWASGWITYWIGRFLGGAASARDLYAALAWSLMPIVWAAIYFAVETVYKRQFIERSGTSEHEAVLNALANGGCSFIVVALAVRFVVAVWCLWIATITVSEAQRFSMAKGLLNVVLLLIGPVVIVVAAAIAAHV